jgi:hypothetical protein
LDTAWATVAAALGGSLLGSLSTWLVGLAQYRRAEKAQTVRERHQAYLGVLDASTQSVIMAQRAGLTLRLRTGINEGLAVLLRQRKPLQPDEVLAWGTESLTRLLDAMTRLHAYGTQAAAEAAHTLIDRCQDLTAAAVASDPEQNAVHKAIKGVIQTEAQQQAVDTAFRRVFAAQYAFLALIRKEIGSDTIKLPYNDERAEPTQTIGHPPRGSGEPTP